MYFMKVGVTLARTKVTPFGGSKSAHFLPAYSKSNYWTHWY